MNTSASKILSLVTATDPDLLEQAEERIDIIKHKLKFLDNKPTVACIELLQPLKIAGEWVPELIGIAGGLPALTEASALTSWDGIQSADPDIMVLMLRGLGMDAALKELIALLGNPAFSDLKAVKNNRLYIADGAKYFYTSGPVLVDSLEILAEIINPKQFIFGYEGAGWMKFSV